MFRKSIGVALAAAALAASGAAASAQDEQPAYYGGLHGGVNDVNGWDATVDFGGGVTIPGQVSASRGAHYGVFGGRQREHTRFEVEYQHGTFDIDRITLGPQTQAMSTGGHYDALTFNAYRTQRLAEQGMGNRLTAYGALGMGWGRVSLPAMGFTGGCNCFPESSKSGLTWLARAGLEYDVTALDKVLLQYTLLHLPRPGSSSSPGVEYDRKWVGAVSLGYRRVF